MMIKSSLLALALAGISASGAADATSQASIPAQPHRSIVSASDHLFCNAELDGELLMRTELVFGLSRSSGPGVTEAEFQRFIDDRVTPRFPNGLTVLSGNGQFKDSSGSIVQEQSKLLVFLYPFSRTRHERVEEIRAEYKEMFQQQSVLRIDAAICASF